MPSLTSNSPLKITKGGGGKITLLHFYYILRRDFESFNLYLQIIPMRWVDWFVYLRVLFILLLCEIRHVWFHANIFLFRLHGLHLLRVLPHAWDCWLPCRSSLRPSHFRLNASKTVAGNHTLSKLHLRFFWVEQRRWRKRSVL